MKTYLAHSLLSSHSCAHTVCAYVGIPTYDSSVATGLAPDFFYGYPCSFTGATLTSAMR